MVELSVLGLGNQLRRTYLMFRFGTWAMSRLCRVYLTAMFVRLNYPVCIWLFEPSFGLYSLAKQKTRKFLSTVQSKWKLTVYKQVHLQFDPSGMNTSEVELSDDELMPLMAKHASRLLDAGVTTARDLGSRGLTAIELRDKIRKGEIPGPRLQCANAPLTIEGGHAHALGGVCCGIEGVRAEVRKRHAEGADLIKVMATGGFLTAGTGPAKAAFTPEEMRAIAEEARDLGMPVTTHATGTEGIERAADARFSSVEHCSWISSTGRTVFDKRIAQKMLDNDMAVCPTVSTTWHFHSCL